MKKLLLMVLAITCFAAACAANDIQYVTFPTATASGTLYAVGAALANTWNKTIPYIRATSQASAGGIENINLVANGEAQVSVAIASNCHQALFGIGPFKDRPFKKLRVLAGLYFNANQIVVNVNSEINDLYDIKGKTFAASSMGSSVYGECNCHFNMIGLDMKNRIKVQYISFGDASDLIQNNLLDGAWIMAGVPAGAVTQALTTNGRLLSLDDKLIDKMERTYPWYTKYTIKANTYPNQPKDIHTTAIKMILFCSEDMSDRVAYDLVRSLWENIEELGKATCCMGELTVKNAVKDISGLPLHPGAKSYYREIFVLR